MPFVFIGIAVGVLLLLFIIFGYLKAPPDTAYIISGLGKKRILIGKAGWRVPFFERVDKLSLGVMQVDIKTSEAVPTNEFINVSVDGVANIKISSDPELLKRAAESLLGKTRLELITLVTQVLEGNMREIVGSVGLKEMVQDRQGVAKKITENVIPDMEKLGIEVVNFNIQNFKDGAGTIENMGIDNVEQIRKNAQIAKANAQRDIAIATSNAQQEANAVKVEAEKKIAEHDEYINSVEVQKTLAEVDFTQGQIDKVALYKNDLDLAIKNFETKTPAEAELINRIFETVESQDCFVGEMRFGSGVINLTCFASENLAPDNAAQALYELDEFDNIVYTGFTGEENDDEAMFDIAADGEILYRFEIQFNLRPIEPEVEEEVPAEDGTSEEGGDAE